MNEHNRSSNTRGLVVVAPGVPGIGETVDDEGNIEDVSSGEDVVESEDRFDDEPEPDRFEDDDSGDEPSQTQPQEDSVGAQQSSNTAEDDVVGALEQREKQLRQRRDEFTRGPQGAVAAQDLAAFRDIQQELVDVQNEQQQIQDGGEPVFTQDDGLDQGDVERAARRQAEDIAEATGRNVVVDKEVNPEATVGASPDEARRFQQNLQTLDPSQNRQSQVPERFLNQEQPIRSPDPDTLQQLQSGQTNPGAPDNTFGTPISDTLELFEFEDGGVPGFPRPSDAVETVEEPISDELGDLVQDVRQIQQGKPAETTQEEILETLDDATRAEGVGGEQSALDVVQAGTELSRDISQTPRAVRDIVSEGETDSFEQSKEFTPEETPVVTAGRLAGEEAAFEGLTRAPRLASDLLGETSGVARAADQAADTVRQAETRSPFDSDQVISRIPEDSTGQGRLTGETDQGVDIGPGQRDQTTGVVEATSRSEEPDTRIVDRESGRALPVGPDTRLGRRIVSNNPEQFGLGRVSEDTASGVDSDELLSELAGRGDEAGDQSVRDILGRGTQDTGVDEAQTQLTDTQSKQTLPGDDGRAAQQVEQPEIRVLNEQTGRFREVRADRAADLLADDDFRFAGREFTPRERTRIQRAQRANRRAGVDLPEGVSRGPPDTQQTSLDLLQQRRGQLDVSGQSRRRGRGVGDTVDNALDETTEQLIREGEDIFPEAQSLPDASSALDEFTPRGARPGVRPRGLTGLLPGQQTGERGLTGAQQDQDTRLVQDTGLEVDGLGDTFQGEAQAQGQDVDTLLKQAQTTRTDTTGRDGGEPLLRDPPGRTGEPDRPRRQEPPGTPPTPELPGLGSNEQATRGGFEALVKQDGEFVDIGDFDSKQAAFEAGSRVADNTAARSVKVHGPSGQAVDVDGIGAQFRESQSTDNVFVEKDEFAIDTEGEKQDITVKGLLSQQNQTTNNSNGPSGGFFDDIGSQNTFDF